MGEWRSLALVLALWGLPSESGSEPLKKITFLTNYVFLGRHAPFFVGLEKGFYRDAGFEIEIAPSTGGGFVIAALEGGKADFGIAEAAPVVQAVAKGARVKAFGIFMDASTSGLASLEPYATPGSIAGKKVAASLTDSARVILPIVFRENGLDPAGIDWIAADPSTYFPLLVQGRAALVTASIDSDVPTFRRVAERQGKIVHFASFASWGYDVFGYFLVTRTDRVAASPAEVRAFARATVQAVRYSIEHPEEAAAILVRHNPTLDRDLMLAHWTESIRAIDTAFVRENGYGAATRDRLVRCIDLVKRGFGLEASLTPEDIYAFGLMTPSSNSRTERKSPP